MKLYDSSSSSNGESDLETDTSRWPDSAMTFPDNVSRIKFVLNPCLG